ncbi:MAG: class I SAM-dependent methyltransferase [Pseudomonadota bacterium]
MKRFAFKGDDVRADIQGGYGYDGPLLDLFARAEGPRINKWHHYIPLYDRYFAPFRGRDRVRMLEIGVAKGGSLKMWRSYFGPEATIFGIDIREKCRGLGGASAEVRIGSQDDPYFLGDVVAEMGGIDIVLDDGSHQMPHVRRTLEILFPMLAPGGIYMIEDLHTAYFPGFEGGVSAEGNFFNRVRELIDDMHHWYHPAGVKHGGVGDAVSGIHVHDSVVVFEKGPVHRPTFSLVGGEG